MKFLLSFLACLIFFADGPNELKKPDKENATATTLVKICAFQFSTSGVGNCTPGSIAIEIDNGCKGVIDAFVKVTNLTNFPVQGQDYSLPLGMPELYYDYVFDSGQSGLIGPVNTFTFKGEYHSAASGQDYPIFEYNTKIEIDVSDECTLSELAEVGLTVQLLDDVGNLYPIEDYAGTDEVFCCEVFLETCDECLTPPQNCSGGAPPVYDLEACGECNNCEYERGEHSEEELYLTEVKIRPNPFSGVLLVQNTLSEASEISIEIINFDGKVVYRKNTPQTAGLNLLRIDTGNFLRGVYFCRIKANSEVFSDKIVKLW